MENAVDALKIAFAVMVFTMALTLAITTFSQARETSEAILYMNDKTNYYEYEIAEEKVNDSGKIYYETSDGITYTSERIVGIEAIIPTLYRYYKENYIVIFDIPGFYVYQTKPDSAGNDKWTKSSGTKDINYFDLNLEITRNCPWVGTVNDIKKNLDLFLKGTSAPGMTLEDKSFGNTARFVTYTGFINQYKNDKFLEQLGEYSTDRTYGINNGFLEVQDSNGDIARFEQVGNLWKCIQANDYFSVGESKSLQDIATEVGSSPTTFLEPDSQEIIELAKPTIKRVIKYTLQTP